jgi:hypothetical protein
MKRIGVILCSKSKKDYACSVREMYDDSSSFRARRIYMDLTYDEWYVNTTSKGFMEPSMVIEPYSGGYIKETRVVWDENILTDDVIDEWVEKLKQQFPNRDEIQLDCHLSLPYYNKLKKIFPNIVHIRPQRTFPDTAWRYVDASNMFLEGKSREECNTFIDERIIKEKNREIPIWFYHPEHEPFFGTSYHLWEKHQDSIPKYMLPELFVLCVGEINVSHGWVTNKDYLPYLKRNTKRWTISKNAPNYTHKAKIRQRRGIKEALIKLGDLSGCSYIGV